MEGRGARRSRRPVVRALLLVPALGLAGRLGVFAGRPGVSALLPGTVAGRAAAGVQAWRRHGGLRRSSCISRLAKGFAAKGGLGPLIKKSRKLPPYVDIYRTKNKTRKALLRRRSQDVAIPLSKKDRRYCSILEAKFDNAKNCVGLAGPQIGIDRRIIVFEVLADDPDNYGRNITDEMKKVLWINPSYSPLTDEMQYDYEACFSVNATTVMGKTPRPTRIAYQATLPNGDAVEGEAENFLARVIMHEIDHVDGILFIDKAYSETVFCTESEDEADHPKFEMLQQFCRENGLA